MGQPSGGSVTLREIKKTTSADFEPVYGVSFDLRVEGIEGTITVPISALDGRDTETVSKARVHLARALQALSQAAGDVA